MFSRQKQFKKAQKPEIWLVVAWSEPYYIVDISALFPSGQPVI